MEKSTLFQRFGQTVEAGRVIFQEGDPGDTMYIIQHGRVKITKRVAEVDKILMVLGKGDFFGEMAIIRQTKRTATATAVDTCGLLTFNREGFLNMISKNTNIAMNIIEKLCQRLEIADNQIRDLAKRDLKSLVISALNDLNRASSASELNGNVLILNYLHTVNNIASQINAPAKEVQQILLRLADTGFLAIEGQNIKIANTSELEKLAGYFK
jgi:CRP/FNR family cyclic AMP-dependent transcriptional regulator